MTGGCIHHLVEAQAARTPDAVALVGAKALTYRQLDEQAAELAIRLRGHGVGPEVVVGVCVERSPSMIVAILAVLKAGGAYLPLDPAWPPARLATAPVSYVLSRTAFADRFSMSAAKFLDIGDVSSPSPKAATVVSTSNLAYVIYTSGSTGQPKGVAVEHRSLVASTLTRTRFYPPARAFVLLSAVAFDSAIAGIFGTLVSGGTLCLPAAGVEADTREIAAFVERHQADALLALPSLYDLLLDSAADPQLDSLRTVVVAGERCPVSVVEKSRTQLPKVDVYNEYGPAEGTVWTTAWQADAIRSTVPIGRPIDGVRAYLLDPSGRPVGGGEGELYIGGAGLARGYLGEPAMTATWFVAGLDGERFYRTGDLCRSNEDGELEFVGRIDRQLKIRGFRVEPAEVEAVLMRHPAVRRAVVIESPRAAGHALAAAVTGDRLDISTLRQFLRAHLPDHLVPAQIRQLPRIPVNANGKVDLATVSELLCAWRDPDVAPRSAVEKLVTGLWCEVLGMDRVGPRESFADLGGSLQAMRIALQLSKTFSVRFPLLWVYEIPTIDGVTRWIEENADLREDAEI